MFTYHESYRGIYMRATSQEVLINPIRNLHSEIAFSKLLLHKPGVI